MTARIAPFDDAPAPPKPDPAQTYIAKDLTHERPLISCRFDPTGKFVFASSEDQNVVRWDLESDAKTVLSGHESWVNGLACTPDGQTLLTGGYDGRLVWWPAAAESPTPIRTIENAHDGWVRFVEMSPDGTLAASCGNDRKIKLWNVADGSPVRTLEGHPKQVYRVRFLPDGKTLVSGDLQGLVKQWEVETGKETRQLEAGKLYAYNGGQGVDYGGIRGMSLSADGKLLACCGLIEASNPLGAVSNPAIVVLDWESGKEKLLQRPKEDIKGVAWGVGFHPSGFLVMVSGGTGGGFLWFFQPDQPNEFHKFSLGNTGRGMDLHPDGLRIATAHHDGHLRISSMTPKPPA